jgi:hypothetical protein
MEAHRVVRRRGAHIFLTIGLQMAVTSALFISVGGWVDPSTIVRLEGLGQLKNPLTSSGIELSDFEYESCGRTDRQTDRYWDINAHGVHDTVNCSSRSSDMFIWQVLLAQHRFSVLDKRGAGYSMLPLLAQPRFSVRDEGRRLRHAAVTDSTEFLFVTRGAQATSCCRYWQHRVSVRDKGGAGYTMLPSYGNHSCKAL